MCFGVLSKLTLGNVFVSCEFFVISSLSYNTKHLVTVLSSICLSYSIHTVVLLSRPVMSSVISLPHSEPSELDEVESVMSTSIYSESEKTDVECRLPIQEESDGESSVLCVSGGYLVHLRLQETSSKVNRLR